jgi:ribosomal protein S12 methylthiotransferase
MTTPSLSIITLGCPKNQVDSEFIASAINPFKINISHSEDFADIVLINTCGFILDAKEQSIETILEYAKARKDGRIKTLIVFGCLVQRYGESLTKEIPEVDQWFGVHDSEKICKFIEANSVIPEIRKRDKLTTPGHYAYIKIAEGCDRQCSFCAIPSIRGKHQSRPIEEIINDAKSLVSEGVKELIVIAQDTTYYGMDLYGKKMLPALLDQLAKESGAEWIRLHYTYPTGFPTELIDVMAKHKNICNYIDIPFQHVNDTILKSMKRNHTQNEMIELINLFRNKIPDICIRTAFIIGFPGETRVEFNELVNFVKKYKPDRMGLFAYSDEEGTAAAGLHSKVAHSTTLKRMDTLWSIQEKIADRTNEKKIGTVMKIIIDEVFDTYILGRTEYDSPEIDNLVTVHTQKGQPYFAGEFIEVKITGAAAWDLIAEPVSL